MLEICGPTDFTTISRLPDELVGNEAGRMLAGAHQHDRNRDVLLRQRRGLEADERREMLEAVLLAAVVERGRVATEVRRDFGLRQTQHAFDRRQRQRVELFARAHHQRVADRERERQADGEDRALARPSSPCAARRRAA